MRHRQADATITLLDATGAPVAGEEVLVAQRRHRFLFGGTDFDLIGLANGELFGERKDVAERSAGGAQLPA
jgi:endo-1,4-beta-xylanase